MNFQTGEILYIDKPYRWTSFDVVNKVRWLLCKRLGTRKLKVGHAGTLDPLATGVMIVCTGRATKRIDELQAHTKEYVATLRLGATTPSFDLEHPIDAYYPTQHITLPLVEDVLRQFIGPIQQIPPAYSAVKVDGKRAYDLARRDKEVELKPKLLVIDEIELLDASNLPDSPHLSSSPAAVASPFGEVIIASTSRGVSYIAFADEGREDAVQRLRNAFPFASVTEQEDEHNQNAANVFRLNWSDVHEVKLHLKGTRFQIKVWESLVRVPAGHLTTYHRLAESIGNANASRAVGSAVADNPVAVLIPCHRVIRSTGSFGQYHWRPERKAAMIGWEAARFSAAREPVRRLPRRRSGIYQNLYLLCP